MKQYAFTTLSAAALAALLIGCGGGSSSSDTTQTGYLVDAPVAGVTYSCGDVNGTTDIHGMFQCKTLPVSFYIGGLKLGEMTAIPADSYLFPQDLVGAARDDFNSSNVVKMAVLLQSLDSDGDPSNGIDINATVTQAFADNGAMTFSDITDVNQTLTDVAGIQAISNEEATGNLESSFNEYNTDMRYVSFTPEWFNGRTLYEVYFTDTNDDGIRETRNVDQFVFGTDTFSAHGVVGEHVNESVSGTYSVTDGNLTTVINGSAGRQFIIAKAEDHVTTSWSDDQGQVDTNYLFLDEDKAKNFSLSDSALSFSTAMLSGKTFYAGDDLAVVSFTDTDIAFASIINPQYESNASIPYTIENGVVKFGDMRLQLQAVNSDYFDVLITGPDGTFAKRMYVSESALANTLPTVSTTAVSVNDPINDSTDTQQRAGFELTNISAKIDGSNLVVTVTAAGDIMSAINSTPPSGYSNILWITVNEVTEFGLLAGGSSYVNTNIYQNGDFMQGDAVTGYSYTVNGSVLTLTLPLTYTGSAPYIYAEAQSGSDLDNAFDSTTEVQDDINYDYVSLLAKRGTTIIIPPAYAIANMMGTWKMGGLFTPVNADTNDSNQFYIDRITGTFENTGAATLTFEDGTQDTFTAGIDPTSGQISTNGTPIYSFVSADENFATGLYIENGVAQSLQPSIKMASSYTMSDLAGTWIYTNLYTPNSTPDAYNTPGELFWIENLQLVVDNDGNTTYTQLYNSLDENESGNFVITVDSGTGQITLGGTTMPLYMNAGKDVIIAQITGEDRVANEVNGTNENSIGIWVKKAASYSQSDLTGTWHAVYFTTPGHLQNPSTQSYGYAVSELVVDAAGNATETTLDDGNGNSGGVSNFTLAMASDGSVTANGAPLHLFMNAGKTVVVRFEDNKAEGTQTLVIYAKQQ